MMTEHFRNGVRCTQRLRAVRGDVSSRDHDTQVVSRQLPAPTGTVLLIIGAMMVVSSATSIPIPPKAADLGRIPGVLLVILGAVQSARTSASRERRSPFPVLQILLFACGYLLYALPSTLPHGLVDLFFQHLSALVMLVALISALWTCPTRPLRDATVFLLLFLLLGSATLWITQPELAVVQGRLRGLTANANTLGFYAFVAVAVFAAQRATKSAILLTFGALIILVFTGSRTSAVATLCVLVLYALFGCRPARRVLVAMALTLGLFRLAWPAALNTVSEALLRADSSRLGSFQVALEAQQTTSSFGVGAGREADEVASSPLRAYVHGGDIALIGMLLMWSSLLWLGGRSNRNAGAFALAAILHSIGEGWLLSAAGPMMIVFVLAFITLVRSSD